MLFRSNLIPIMVRYQLRVILEYIFLSVKFYRPLNRPLSLYTFFNNYSINKIQTFIFLFSGGFQSISPCGFKDLCRLKEPLWIQRLFSKANLFCFLFSRSRRVILLGTSASCINGGINGGGDGGLRNLAMACGASGGGGGDFVYNLLRLCCGLTMFCCVV